ncbi:MAG: hypothetical protein GY839_17665 [candidate division Zixibacteria bacterium]|nr:hypothetical protein [candidate division Zixibacteria bacterium]
MKDGIVEKLKTLGWQDQFTASGARLDEAVDTYRRLGFEVRTIPVRVLNREGCSVCIDDKNDETMMIFTRENGKSDNNSLYDDIDGRASSD